MKEYFYRACCVELEGPDIQAMVDKAQRVSLKTMKQHCAGLDEWAKNMKYERDARHGLTLQKDWHVTYWKSVFRRKSCYFLVHSAIEYIWTKVGE